VSVGVVPYLSLPVWQGWPDLPKRAMLVHPAARSHPQSSSLPLFSARDSDRWRAALTIGRPNKKVPNAVPGWPRYSTPASPATRQSQGGKRQIPSSAQNTTSRTGLCGMGGG
jgi:hypothetical protein